MAFITLSGVLRDPTSEYAVGDQVRFTHKSTTGETIESAVSVLTVAPDGAYDINLEYGLVLVEYKDIKKGQFKSLGVVTVNSDNPATNLPELLNAIVPVSSAELIEFQAILADCIAAKDAAEGFADDAEQSAQDAANSAASVEWKDIRYSKLDNPLTHLFKKNKLVNTLSGGLTWARASNATYIDLYGVMQYAAIDEPRQEKEGWLIEGASTNLLTYSEALNNHQTVMTSIVDNAIVAAGITFSEMTEDSSNTTHECRPNTLDVTSGEKLSLSFFAKAKERGIVAIRWATGGGAGTASFDLIQGVVISNNYLSADIKYLSDGVYRCSIVVEATGTDAETVIRLQMRDSQDTSSYQGDGVSGVYMTGIQCERLPFTSSYIPTTDSPSTRSADRVSADGTDNMPLLSSANTVSLTVSTLGFDPNRNQAIFGAFADDVYNRSMSFWAGKNKTVLNRISGTNRGVEVPTSREDVNNIVTTFTGSGGQGYVNGVLVRSDDYEYTDTEDNATSLFFGGNTDNTTALLYGHISDFRIYDFALNAAEVSFLAGE